MTTPFKHFLLSGAATVALAIGLIAAEPQTATAEDATADGPVIGRLDSIAPVGAEQAPEWLGEQQAEAVSADSDDQLAEAYAKAEAMAAALTDTQITDSKEWLADQLAELAGDTAETTAEQTEEVVPATLTAPLAEAVEPVAAETDVAATETPAEVAEISDEAVETADAAETEGATEIFSGDVPVRTEIIILSPVPVPSAKPEAPVEAKTTGLTIDVETVETADAIETMEADTAPVEAVEVASSDSESVLATASGLSRDFVQVAEAATVVAGEANGDVKAIIHLAIENHPRVLGDRASILATREALREQRSDFFPTVSLEASSGYRNTDNRTTRARPTRGPGGDPDVTGFANEGTVRLRQLLFDFFATPNLVEAARQRLSQSQFVESDSQEQIGLRAIEAYLLVQQSRRNASFARDNVDFHVQTLSDIQRRAEAGAGDSGDVSQTESRLALAREVLLGFEEQLAIASADFKEAVGSMPGELGPLNPPAEPIPTTIGEAVAIATEENPFITASRFNAHSLSHEVEAAEGDLYPRFDADISYNRGSDVDGLGGGEEETRALVRMVWDFPTGGAEYAARKRLMREKDAADQETEERFRLIEEEVRSSYAEVTITQKQIEQLAERVESANAVVDAYQRQFEAGRRTLLDLLDSENERFLARVSLNNGQSDLIRANYRLFTAMGRLRHVLDIDSTLVEVDAE
ncbi:MAG: TolC family outer membrane protein [Alphaproteobacteria bacterium]|nr:TolC family outer membrane protein [Alphaproteobacteria bacterium SS10]